MVRTKGKNVSWASLGGPLKRQIVSASNCSCYALMARSDFSRIFQKSTRKWVNWPKMSPKGLEFAPIVYRGLRNLACQRLLRCATGCTADAGPSLYRVLRRRFAAWPSCLRCLWHAKKTRLSREAHPPRSEERTRELQSREKLVCRLHREKK